MGNFLKRTITCVTSCALCLTIAVPAVLADEDVADIADTDVAAVEDANTEDSVIVKDGDTVIRSDQTIENWDVQGNLFIEKGVTVTMVGENTIEGNLYVFGTVYNSGTLTIENTLYCLHYNSELSAGEYDYGYFTTTGLLYAENMSVTDEFLDVEIPDDDEQPEVTEEPETTDNEDKEESKEDEKKAVPELTISKKSDKTEYMVNESILYTIELDQTVEDATATDVVVTDIMPDGMYIKDVSVEGAEADITYINADVNAETTTITVDDTEVPSVKIDENMTVAEVAELYLEVMPFSAEGLINQLVYSGYTEEEARTAVEGLDVDWNEQAMLKAINYLDVMAFSYEGLIGQLEYEKFTEEQATYGADNCGADWDEQAILKGQEYLDSREFTAEELIAQLEYEKFTTEQAEYAVKALLEDATVAEDAEKTVESEAEGTDRDGVEIVFESVAYDDDIVITIEAYAETASEYVNTASVESAETEEVSDSVTVTVTASEEVAVVSNDGNTNSGDSGIVVNDSGTVTDGTTVTDGAKTADTMNMAVLMAIALTAGISLAGVTLVRKAKI